MLANRQWKTERLGQGGGIMRLGQRTDLPELPPDAVVSITHGVGLSVFQTLLNSLVNHLVILPPLARNPDLFYAELHGDLLSGESLTLTVWRGKGMTKFRDNSAHGWARQLLTGVVFGGQATLWFLTYQPRDRRLPSADEARPLSKRHGRMMHNGRYVRAATRPIDLFTQESL